MCYGVLVPTVACARGHVECAVRPRGPGELGEDIRDGNIKYCWRHCQTFSALGIKEVCADTSRDFVHEIHPNDMRSEKFMVPKKRLLRGRWSEKECTLPATCKIIAARKCEFCSLTAYQKYDQLTDSQKRLMYSYYLQLFHVPELIGWPYPDSVKLKPAEFKAYTEIYQYREYFDMLAKRSEIKTNWRREWNIRAREQRIDLIYYGKISEFESNMQGGPQDRAPYTIIKRYANLECNGYGPFDSPHSPIVVTSPVISPVRGRPQHPFAARSHLPAHPRVNIDSVIQSQPTAVAAPLPPPPAAATSIPSARRQGNATASHSINLRRRKRGMFQRFGKVVSVVHEEGNEEAAGKGKGNADDDSDNEDEDAEDKPPPTPLLNPNFSRSWRDEDDQNPENFPYGSSGFGSTQNFGRPLSILEYDNPPRGP